MKKILMSLLVAAALTIVATSKVASAGGESPTLSFCGKTVTMPADEPNSLENDPALIYNRTIDYVLDEDVYQANKEFFDDVPRRYLSMGSLEIKKTGDKYWIYRTVEDDCDGGNTFGIIVSEKTSQQIAEINDGDITCY